MSQMIMGVFSQLKNFTHYIIYRFRNFEMIVRGTKTPDPLILNGCWTSIRRQSCKTVNEIFENEDMEAVILVDASNAFN